MPESAYRWGQPLDQTAQELFQNTESGAGGFYPIGANRLWHSGIHLTGTGVFHALASGRVVAARLSADPLESGNTNFVLVRHRVQVPPDTKGYEVFSLYMHLLPVPLRADDPQTRRLSWLAPLLRHPSAELEPNAIYWKLNCAARNFRREPREADNFVTDADGVRLIVRQGEYAECLRGGSLQNGWANVRYRGQEGWYGVGEPGGNAVSVSPRSDTVAHDLRDGKVVALDEPVRQGDPLGFMGQSYGVDLLHVEVFSRELIPAFESMPLVRDDDRDSVCDVEDLLRRVDSKLFGILFRDGKITAEEAKNAAPELRDHVCYHCSEWAASDWSFLAGRPWNLEGAELDAEVAKIRASQWWTDAVEAGVDLPSPPMVYTYHPVRFVEVLRDRFASLRATLELQFDLCAGRVCHVTLWRETAPGLGVRVGAGATDAGVVSFSSLELGRYVVKCSLTPDDPELRSFESDRGAGIDLVVEGDMRLEVGDPYEWVHPYYWDTGYVHDNDPFCCTCNYIKYHSPEGGWSTKHDGVDMNGGPGCTISAVRSGEIAWIGINSYGRVVILRHDFEPAPGQVIPNRKREDQREIVAASNSVWSAYCHLGSFATVQDGGSERPLQLGDRVRIGQALGLEGGSRGWRNPESGSYEIVTKPEQRPPNGPVAFGAHLHFMMSCRPPTDTGMFAYEDRIDPAALITILPILGGADGEGDRRATGGVHRDTGRPEFAVTTITRMEPAQIRARLGYVPKTRNPY